MDFLRANFTLYTVLVLVRVDESGKDGKKK